METSEQTVNIGFKFWVFHGLKLDKDIVLCELKYFVIMQPTLIVSVYMVLKQIQSYGK